MSRKSGSGRNHNTTAASGHSQPPQQPPQAAATSTEHKGEAEQVQSSGRSRKRRRSRKSGAAAASWSLQEFLVEPVEVEIRFPDLALRDELMHGIADLGFHYCSPIQGAILPHTLQGHDAIGKAQTGTGKTAAFLITIFNDQLCNP